MPWSLSSFALGVVQVGACRRKATRGVDTQKPTVLFITPEYNRSIPGGSKNAIDWASRPWGQNSFDHIPAAVIGASTGPIGTAVSQQSLRGVLSFCNARQMTAPEAYIRFTPEFSAPMVKSLMMRWRHS